MLRPISPYGGAWQGAAACRNGDLGMFFAPTVEADHARRARVAGAKAVCARCPVSVACLQDALDRNERFGVWGGLTPEERLPLSTGEASA